MISDKILAIFPGIFIKPAQTWQVINADTNQALRYFLYFGFPFVLAGAFGRALTDQGMEQFVGSPFFLLLLLHFLAQLITLTAGSYMIARLAGNYGLRPEFAQVIKLSLAAYIPYLFSFLIRGFVPMLDWLPYAGLAYAVFLFWNGADKVLNVPADRLTGFTLLSFFVFLGLGLISLYLFRMIIFAPVTQG